jgi:hypothetical protein
MDEITTIRSPNQQSQGSSNSLLDQQGMSDAMRYLISQKTDLVNRVAEIEKFLGFANQAEDLAVRVAKLERFMGLSG